MLNLEFVIEYFCWLFGIKREKLQPLYIPIESEERKKQYDERDY